MITESDTISAVGPANGSQTRVRVRCGVRRSNLQRGRARLRPAWVALLGPGERAPAEKGRVFVPTAHPTHRAPVARPLRSGRRAPPPSNRCACRGGRGRGPASRQVRLLPPREGLVVVVVVVGGGCRGGGSSLRRWLPPTVTTAPRNAEPATLTADRMTSISALCVFACVRELPTERAAVTFARRRSEWSVPAARRGAATKRDTSCSRRTRWQPHTPIVTTYGGY
eukprot:scaffold2585_cov368-Prasinococcus_capsulatus_cf.AAC.10